MPLGLQTSTQTEGLVRRHSSRGVDSPGLREHRRLEDARCMAGLRNPGMFSRNLARTWGPMSQVASAISAVLEEVPSFTNLVEALGDDGRWSGWAEPHAHCVARGCPPQSTRWRDAVCQAKPLRAHHTLLV